jgi:hypothetical protein
MEKNVKTPAETRTIMTNIVLPNETNALGICLVVSFFLEWTERLLLLRKT